MPPVLFQCGSLIYACKFQGIQRLRLRKRRKPVSIHEGKNLFPEIKRAQLLQVRHDALLPRGRIDFPRQDDIQVKTSPAVECVAHRTNGGLFERQQLHLRPKRLCVQIADGAVRETMKKTGAQVYPSVGGNGAMVKARIAVSHRAQLQPVGDDVQLACRVAAETPGEPVLYFVKLDRICLEICFPIRPECLQHHVNPPASGQRLHQPRKIPEIFFSHP